MSRILAIDTTGDICSLALTGPELELDFHHSLPRQHARLIMPEIQRLFDQAGWRPRDLDYIVYGRGPGSFTGIRIAAGVAQGIALGIDCGVVPISTLETVAFEVASESDANSDLWVALDARMQELYLAVYSFDEEGLPELEGTECLIKPEQLPEPPEPLRLAGNGWMADYGFSTLWQQRISGSRVLGGLPKAKYAARLAELQVKRDDQILLPPELALPTYLRDNVTWDKPVKT